MKDYPNGELLVTPEQLEREIESGKPQLVLDLRPPEAYTAGHVPGATHIDLWGVSLIHRPGPAQGLHVDDRARACDPWRQVVTLIVVYDEQSGGTGRAGVLVPRVFRPSSGPCSRRRIRRMVPRRPSDVTRCRPGAPERLDGRPGRRTHRDLARGAGRHRPRRRGDPRHENRRRALRHDGAGRAGRRRPRSRAHRVDPQSWIARRLQAGVRAQGDVPGGGVTPDREVFNGTARAATGRHTPT